MDQAQCHIHGTSHRIEWLVELRALLGGLGSTDASVVVDSSLVAVAVDSSPVAVDSNPVVEVEVADSNLDAAVVAVVAAVEAVAVVEQVGSTAFGLEPRDEGGLLLYRLQVRT